MTALAMDSADDYSRYVGQVYDKQRARLLRYFWVQLGDPSEAEECVRETICRLFLFMRGRRWNDEAEYIPVYLMRLAGMLCMERLAEKKSQAADGPGDAGGPDGFDKIKDAATHSIKERLRAARLSRISMAGG